MMDIVLINGRINAAKLVWKRSPAAKAFGGNVRYLTALPTGQEGELGLLAIRRLVAFYDNCYSIYRATYFIRVAIRADVVWAS